MRADAFCPREDELLEAMTRGFVGDELAAHVADCVACGELQLAAGAVLDDRAQAMREAAVPGAGTMWWRMQLRLRHEAQARARRSLVIGQALTLAIALTLVASLFGTNVAAGARYVVASIETSTPLLLALAASMVLAPFGGWIALRQK